MDQNILFPVKQKGVSMKLTEEELVQIVGEAGRYFFAFTNGELKLIAREMRKKKTPTKQAVPRKYDRAQDTRC